MRVHAISQFERERERERERVIIRTRMERIKHMT